MAFTNENPKCNIHPMHFMQDSTFTVYSNISTFGEGICYESIFAKAESFYLNFLQEVFKIFPV